MCQQCYTRLGENARNEAHLLWRADPTPAFQDGQHQVKEQTSPTNMNTQAQRSAPTKVKAHKAGRQDVCGEQIGGLNRSTYTHPAFWAYEDASTECLPGRNDMFAFVPKHLHPYKLQHD